MPRFLSEKPVQRLIDHRDFRNNKPVEGNVLKWNGEKFQSLPPSTAIFSNVVTTTLAAGQSVTINFDNASDIRLIQVWRDVSGQPIDATILDGNNPAGTQYVETVMVPLNGALRLRNYGVYNMTFLSFYYTSSVIDIEFYDEIQFIGVE